MKTYWRIYVVMYRWNRNEPFEPWLQDGRISSWVTRDEARQAMKYARRYYGKGNVYVQKCGAIS